MKFRHARSCVRCRTDLDTMNLITLVAGLRAEPVSPCVFRLVPGGDLSDECVTDLRALAAEELDLAVARGLIRAWRWVELAKQASTIDHSHVNGDLLSRTARRHHPRTHAA